MKVRTVLSDGSANDDVEFDLKILDQDGNPYDDPVVMRCRPMDAKERKSIERSCEHFVRGPKGQGMQRATDWDKVGVEVFKRTCVSWTGVYGADGKPLVCTDETKPHIPLHIQAQVAQAVLSTEDAQSASFRQPASVV